MKTLSRLFILFLAMLSLHGAALAQQARNAPGANRPSITVAELRDLGNTGQGEAFLTMIQTALTQTNRFNVIERDFRGLMAEQELAASGRVRSNTPGRRGGFASADFQVMVSITQAQARESRNPICSILAGNAPVSCRQSSIALSVDIRIREASTGRIRVADTIRQDENDEGESGVDVLALFRTAAQRIARDFTLTMYPIQVAAVQPDGSYLLNYGEDVLSLDDQLRVFGQEAQCIPDPTTGECLTSDGTEFGWLRVTEVTPRYSRAMPLEAFAQTPPVGSVARIVPVAERRRVRGGRNNNRNRDRN